MGITKRAGRKAAGTKQAPPKRGAGGIKKATFEVAKKKEVGVSDLTLLSKVSDEAINDNLKKRFENGIIYTYIGHVLISVNPFRDLGIYTEEVVQSYRGKNRLEVAPHVFAIAESMYYKMKSYHENQCVIISGESGAGKTEAAKRIMQYIASVSGESSSDIQKIKDMVLATNPLLESFGCAKTLRNDNSSRHGKYLEILFNRQGEPVGANITNYLLEKGRVVGQIQNERNFHIFYQFTKGATDEQRQSFGIQTPETYIYTSKSRCTTVNSIDDMSDFQQTLKAMEIIGLGKHEQDEILRLLAAILWIGNVDFVENDEGNAKIRDESVPNFVAYLLSVDAEAIERALTLRIVETSRGGRRGSIYESPLNVVQARAVRDALAKGIYNNLFDWIVERVNQSLRSTGAAEKTIGILDIYGFEIFDNNNFEQICINYVNEKLQQIFIELTLKTEQEEYVREQIQWTPIKYFNNKVVCDLIEDKRTGIFTALNDAVATAHADSSAADQNFAMKLGFMSSNPHFEQRQSKFIIKHYAGDVTYDIDGMTDKNKDQLQKDLLILLSKSTNGFLHTLFPQQVDTDNRRRPPTASDKIRQSANALMHTLSQAEPSYIRTIKPNQNRSASEYDVKAVLHQVKYLGLQENVRIRRAGFAYRTTFEKFTERFYLLSGKTSYAGEYTWHGDPKTAVAQILRDSSVPDTEFQMGVTKVFIKTPETLFALEHMRDMYWHNMAARIQRAWRRYMKYKADMATKIQRFWRESKNAKKYTEFRDKGHAILAGRKERRRFSLLGYRRFWGDYLDCNNPSSAGGFLAKSIGLTDKVRFSCRGQILHAKFGRSSQRLDRVFILTSSKFYIVHETVVNNQLGYTIERAIPVSSIRQINMSNLRDDWFAFAIGSSSEPDPLMWCHFKTELATWIGAPVQIEAGIQYCKKPTKPTTVKVQKDSTIVKDDVYKSGIIHVPPGEPANSVSEPVPKPKPRPGKAQTTRPAPRQQQQPVRRVPPAAPQPQPLPSGRIAQNSYIPDQRLQHNYEEQTRDATAFPAAAAAASAAMQQHNQTSPRQSFDPTPTAQKRQSRAPPPPPPPAQPEPSLEPEVPAEPMAKVLYDFNAESDAQLSIRADEVIIIVQKENNGWWLARHQGSSKQGWAPAAFVQEIEQAAAVKPKKKPPPAPPKPKPKPAGFQSGDNSASSSSANLGSGLAEALKQKSQANNKLAGGLAEALKARQQATRSDDEEDDDW
ncbi:myosin-5 [Trichomonascus vanleenenianus]|uniref:myosin 5 n=1 Tax=Trichomonascus vanleenenianus TaxID=2268995 RepID=UPI003ECB2625